MSFATTQRWVATLAFGGLLAGCAGVGSSSVAPQMNANPVLGGMNHATAPFDAASNGALYAANLDGTPGNGNVFVYSANLHSSNQSPIRTISTGTTRPLGMWVDSAGILYVINIPNAGPAGVSEFRPGESKPFRTITEGLYGGEAVAVDRAGTVYVNNRGQDNGFVTVYAPGSVHLQRKIQLNVAGYDLQPDQMAFDKEGNLLVAVDLPERALHILKIAPGSSHATPLHIDLTGLAGPGLAADGAGNLYVSGSTTGGIAVFPPGAAKRSRTIPNAGGPMSVTHAGALYALGGQGIAEFAPGGSKPVNSITAPSPSFITAVAVGAGS